MRTVLPEERDTLLVQGAWTGLVLSRNRAWLPHRQQIRQLAQPTRDKRTRSPDSLPDEP